jgi:hypothetical protein
MFGYIGTISYLLLKRYSSSLAMIKPKILVTGATGKTGGAVVTESACAARCPGALPNGTDTAGVQSRDYDRAQEQPMPPTPHLALDDAGWAASHGIEDLVVEGGTFKEALA